MRRKITGIVNRWFLPENRSSLSIMLVKPDSGHPVAFRCDGLATMRRTNRLLGGPIITGQTRISFRMPPKGKKLDLRTLTCPKQQNV